MTKPALLHRLRMILGLALFIGCGRALQAGIAVSPLKQEVSLRADEHATLKITLTHNSRADSDPPQAVHVALADVQVSEAGALNFKDPATLPNSAAKWIKLDQSDVVLGPGKSQIVECTLTPTPDAAPGEYYVSILVTLANKEKNEKGVMVEYRIASGIFVTILGRNYPKQAKIVRAELNWPQIPGSQPATQASTKPAADVPADDPSKPEVPKVTVLLQNTGLARFDGSGKVTVVDERARAVFVAPLASVRPCVFAGDSRLFEAPITKALPAGKYRLKIEMDYQSTWALARYEMPIEILPEYAEALAKLHAGEPSSSVAAEITPEKLAPTLRPGATRSLALTLRNVSDGTLRCAATVAQASPVQASDAWITVTPATFSIDKATRKSIEVKVQVPADAKPGNYLSHVALDAGPEGSTSGRLLVPVEIEIRSEKTP